MESTTLLKMARDLRVSAQALEDHGVINPETIEATFEIRRVASELYDEGIKARKSETNAKYGRSDYKDEMDPTREIRRIFGVNYKIYADAACKLFKIRDLKKSEFILAYTASTSDKGHIVAEATPEFQLNIAVGIIEYFKKKGYIKVIAHALEELIHDESSE